MGEEAKQEPPKAEEKPAEEKKGEKPVEEKKEPKPPSPFEGVVIDMAKNEVIIKGIAEAQAICNIITKKTKRTARVISPLPEAEGEPIPEVVTSQVSGPVTVELNVNMHCEACAEQLKGKILKMRGVQKAVTELSTGKVIVTGTMDANKLVDYVYRRTKKQAKILPQPEPGPEPEKENKEVEKPAAEEAKPADEEKKVENSEKKEEGSGDEEENKEEKGGEEVKEEVGGDQNGVDEEGMKRMMYYQPLSLVERIPSPQLFSDENPNACCIS
ncbi:Heavy metal-associated domain, HMA [Sesbania bispinosa]|nr:Heavy metal-associated domain, HMA [Sesbania bispinosa]